jgi:DNA ligase-associated metallophosphoesterase
MSALPLNIAGERLLLYPERAAYWPARRTLLITDTHWGKASTMRAAAIPIPGGTTRESLDRLSQLIESTAARRLVMLGDSIHARSGRSPQTMAELAAWRGRHAALDLLLIRGNHDQSAGDPPPELGIRCFDAPLVDAPFVYRHWPKGSEEGYTLSGHLHPAIRVRGRAAETAKLACFWFGPSVGVLPAFGGLTGTAIIHPNPGDRICAIAGDEIIPIRY